MHGFISYARADRGDASRDRDPLIGLMKRLEMDTRNGGPVFWADTSLRGGQGFDARIAVEIGRAEIFLLLVSYAFLGSRYIREVELPAIRNRAAACDGLIVPVILEKCTWVQSLKECSLQVVPTVSGHYRAISQFRNYNDWYYETHTQLQAAFKAWELERKGAAA